MTGCVAVTAWLQIVLGGLWIAGALILNTGQPPVWGFQLVTFGFLMLLAIRVRRLEEQLHRHLLRTRHGLLSELYGVENPDTEGGDR